jgi:hypothetical protein
VLDCPELAVAAAGSWPAAAIWLDGAFSFDVVEPPVGAGAVAAAAGAAGAGATSHAPPPQLPQLEPPRFRLPACDSFSPAINIATANPTTIRPNLALITKSSSTKKRNTNS